MIKSSHSSKKTCFVTVGSTSFDGLVHSILSPSSLAALAAKGFTRLVVQHGNSKLPPSWLVEDTSGRLEVETFTFKDGVEECVREADLVVSHAGAGSILTTLRLDKPLIVVVNLSLMDNHQSELADTLKDKNYLLVATPETLAETISRIDHVGLEPFPPPEHGAFLNILNQEMGYSN
ncbi:glycosyl transferase [Mrakia frigida]|uniref:N-acetylglucosaminyldiphosphodolichol N-acetylglucosaminyltransferase catalytic subunit ALG13 n=1 Tax=Mrakia frigida TaxID=29902 RepID=UPI003FCC1D71